MSSGCIVRLTSNSPLLSRVLSYTTKASLTSIKHDLPSDFFQSSLPTLKVPSLDKTLQRYISSQKALLDSEQLKHTERLCSRFATEQGPLLQRKLQDFAHANRHTSYVTDLWFDLYLRDRRPVVMTHNPTMGLVNSSHSAGHYEQSVRATNLVYHALKFSKSLRSNQLPPEIFHLNPKKSDTLLFRRLMGFVPKSVATYAAYLFNAYPLDMSQYPSMFNTTRVPHPHKDRIVTDPSAHHLLVIHRGQMYVFDVFNAEGDPISPHQLLSNIKLILSRPAIPSAPGIGLLTTLPRDEAFIARERLINLGNKANFALVDSALFALVLDDEDPMDITGTFLNFLAGPAESRWFDKSLSLLIDRTGQAAVNFEHSWGDGVAVVRFCRDIYFRSESSPVVGPDDAKLSTECLPEPTVRRLEWVLDDRFLKDVLLPAKEKYNEHRHSLLVDFAIKDNLSKRRCKQAGLSPDAIMQLTFQMAHDLVHSCPAATYESCSTAAFKHGRTETLRSATWETRQFVEIMRRTPGLIQSFGGDGGGQTVARDVSEEELWKALTACSARHSQLTKEAAMGQGWDRHLFALKHFAALEVGRAIPDLFLDENYERINEIVLSTSTLPVSMFSMGGFAPVNRDGYGIGYMIENDRCGAIYTSWRESHRTNAGKMADAFSASVDRLANLIERKIADC